MACDSVLGNIVALYAQISAFLKHLHTVHELVFKGDGLGYTAF